MTSRIEIPRDTSLDSSLALLSEGYLFIQNRSRKYNSNIFRTRLMGQQVICISGKDAAEVFYDPERFQRKGAAPKRIQHTLFGENGVQTMDGEKHEHRKLLFMSLMTPEHLMELKDIAIRHWQMALEKWEKMKAIVFFEETEEVMCQIACEWAGVPLRGQEVKQRTKDLGALIDAFGAVGPRYWQGRMARKRTEKWIDNLIEQVRSGRVYASENKALHAMAWHQNLNGNLMDTHMAAVELINVIRPIVAIARYITFGALALHTYPETREKIQAKDEKYTQMFVQEVRRFYPFGPFVGARVKKDFFWGGHDFKQGTLVLLDIYGTNHDPKIWEKPYEFKPERFATWDHSPFDFIPQGGGDYIGHRCAGEWLTIETMKTSIDFLVNHMKYEVPEQNLSYSLIRMPSIIRSRFIIRDVRKVK